MSVLLSAPPLRPEHIVLLSNAGFCKLDDLKDVSPTQLSEDLQISCEEARDIIKTIQKLSSNVVDENESHSVFAPMNAFELFEREKDRVSIVTFCEQLDEMLGGGVPTGKITEFCGPPGIGKTQMGMQLAVDVQVPGYFGGLEGKAIYIGMSHQPVIEAIPNPVV